MVEELATFERLKCIFNLVKTKYQIAIKWINMCDWLSAASHLKIVYTIFSFIKQSDLFEWIKEADLKMLCGNISYELK